MSSPLPPPLPPFHDWPVQLADRRFGYAWYTSPGVFVNQIHAPHGTVEVANALHDAIDHLIERRRQDFEQYGGVLMIHDWRQMRGYDKAARQAYLDRMRARAPGYVRLAVAVLPNTPLLRMAVQTANVLMALTVGGAVRIANDPVRVLAEHHVARPTRTDW